MFVDAQWCEWFRSLRSLFRRGRVVLKAVPIGIERSEDVMATKTNRVDSKDPKSNLELIMVSPLTLKVYEPVWFGKVK